MIDTLLLHPQTRAELAMVVKSRPHAVLLAGDHGAGKHVLSRALAAAYLQKSSVKTMLADPYVLEITPDGGTIGIEAVRGLRKFLALRTTGSTPGVRRIAIISEAHTMTTEAQNALLKLLEEPPEDTAFIMTVDHPHHLLPTVNSRVQAVRIMPVSSADAAAYMPKVAPSAVERAYLLSAGMPGLFVALARDDTTHPLVADIQAAKAIYGQTSFQRLITVDSLSKQKERLGGLLMALKRIAKAALEQAIKKQDSVATSRWHARLGAIHGAEVAASHNANTKLLLTHLFLAL